MGYYERRREWRQGMRESYNKSLVDRDWRDKEEKMRDRISFIIAFIGALVVGVVIAFSLGCGSHRVKTFSDIARERGITEMELQAEAESFYDYCNVQGYSVSSKEAYKEFRR